MDNIPEKFFLKLPQPQGRFLNWPLLSNLFITLLLAIPHLSDRDFWYDESLTGLVSQLSFSEIIKMLSSSAYLQPPLYIVMVKIFANPFGYSPIAIRGLSLVAGLFGVSGVYFLARKLFNAKVAFWAALMAATSPFILHYATEARSYSLAGTFVVWSAILLARAVQKNHVIDHIGWGLMMVSAVMAHYTALLFVPVFLFSYFAGIIYGSDSLSHGFWNIVKRIPRLILAALVALTASAIWLAPLLRHFHNRTNSWVPEIHITEIGEILRIFLFGTVPGSIGVPPSIEFRIQILNDIVPYALAIFVAGISMEW